MAQWRGSNRREHLPDDWKARRRRVLRRDGYRYTWRHDGVRCLELATDVDHIVPGDDHGDANLRSLCDWHHQHKSSAEGGVARAEARRRTDRRFRRSEPHPGLL